MIAKRVLCATLTLVDARYARAHASEGPLWMSEVKWDGLTEARILTTLRRSRAGGRDSAFARASRPSAGSSTSIPIRNAVAAGCDVVVWVNDEHARSPVTGC